MAILKCKMCGGDMEVSADKTFGTCECCGTVMTLPKIDDEQRAEAFNRGNHFRRLGEFDKALQVYEHLVQEMQDDAEAHWCCALCRFGIEYVEDPTTYEYIPTCHRLSFDNFTEDVDYLAAIEHSDGITKKQYMKDGAKIHEVQRAVLATSQREEPFDVFICYKESDANGNRTVDSTLAQDIYYQLTNEGLRVFYAKITLEDKAGSEYEPYIFAALNSAKVMVIVGTSSENLNAVWVKNEWSRFLSIVKKDRTKVILPCYRDMDPYDMPEQLSVLQSYDMSKIGFIQDLIRGIKKITETEKPAESVKETIVVGNTANANTEPLLKRAFMFLEDGEWEKADDFCEQVLNINPEEPRAYLGKLMAELKIKKEDKLKDSALPFDESNNYQKAYRFADDTMKAKLESDIKFINDRNENARKQSIYDKAKALVKDDIQSLNEAISLFSQISGWKDADMQIENCKKKIEEIKEKNEIARKDDVYSRASNKSRDSIAAVEQAIELYKQIPGWKDADSQLELAKTKLAELNAKKEEERIAAAKARKKAMKIIAVVGPVVAAVIVFLVVLVNVIIPNSKYNSAMELYEQGKYEEAMENFIELGGFKDSAAKLGEIKHIPEVQKMLIKNSKEGDVITFGKYNNNDLEWQILDKQDNIVLVVTKKAVAKEPYNEEREAVTWETCTLRGWLNDEFLISTFTDEERKIIKETAVKNDSNPKHGTTGGNDTQDKIFLLSIDEAEKYFKNDGERVCKMIDSDDTCWWWLRSPGHFSYFAALVLSSGNVLGDGNSVHNTYGVRPALWINLES